MASRTLKKSPTTGRVRKSWKDIDQSVKPKTRSSAAEKRVWMDRIKIGGLALAAVAVVVAALQLSVFVDKGPELLSKAGESLPIKYIDIETDGSLSKSWLENFMDLDDSANLLSVDLGNLKGRLESIGQVKHAIIERRFPDTLRVSISERHPVARLLAQRANGEKLLLFVDDSGSVFESVQIDRTVARSLPYLKGVALKRSHEGFSDIENMEPVARLLREAKAVAPHIYQTWRVVTPDKADSVVIKNHRGSEMLFDLEADFRQQLSKLDYIMDYYRGRISKQMSHVDLTLGDQVPVKSMHASRQ